MIDLHCHMLPGIDDGAATYEESLEMARIAVNQNISAVAVTHHFYDEKNVNPFIDTVSKKLAYFENLILSKGLNLKVYHGAEVYINPFLPELEGLNGLCINNSRYLLLELPVRDIPRYTEDVIYHLVLKGYVPIIAHPERNISIINNPNLLHPLINLGALAQVTAASVTGANGKASRKCAQILFDKKMAHFIATDAHSANHRAPLIRQAIKTLSKWVGDRAAKEATEAIPDAILHNLPIITEDPDIYKKKFSLFR